VVLKTQLLSPGSGYGTSKCVSEMLVRQAFIRGLPDCIVRPGSICPSLTTGRSNPNDFLPKYFLSITQMQKAPYLPAVKVSMISVNFVSHLTIISTLSPIQQSLVLPVYHCLGSTDNNLSLTNLTQLAIKERHKIEEVDYVNWWRELSLMNDPNCCALVPLKSYFKGGFPSALDRDICDDALTMEFVKEYNAAIVELEERLELDELKEERVSRFFSNENLVALRDALHQ